MSVSVVARARGPRGRLSRSAATRAKPDGRAGRGSPASTRGPSRRLWRDGTGPGGNGPVHQIAKKPPGFPGVLDTSSRIPPPEEWWSQGESNPRPLECHSSALPTELWPHGGDGRRTVVASPRPGKRIPCAGGAPPGDASRAFVLAPGRGLGHPRLLVGSRPLSCRRSGVPPPPHRSGVPVFAATSGLDGGVMPRAIETGTAGRGSPSPPRRGPAAGS